MAGLRSHVCSFAVRNLGEQVPVLFSFLSGRQKLPPAKIQAMVAFPNREFICIVKSWEPYIYYRTSLQVVVHCVKG